MMELGNTLELPDFLTQEIQSILDYEDVYRTCTLNKSWLHSWRTYPILDFDCGRSRIFTGDEEANFLKTVTTTLARYRRDNLLVRKLLLGLQDRWIATLDGWLETAAECGLESLSLRFLHILPPLDLLPPLKTLPVKKNLRELSIADTRFGNGRPIVQCPHLVFLKLSSVCIDDFTLGNLISSCPSIETLILDECYGHKKIELVGLERLKQFQILVHGLNTVKISVPGISLVSYKKTKGFCCQRWLPDATISIFEFDGSRNLTKLELLGPAISRSFLNQILPRTRFLKDLTLKHCDLKGRIEIRRDSLNKLSLAHMHDLKELKICAPNLRVLEYVGENLLHISFTRHNNLAKLKFQIKLEASYDIHNNWFLKLRQVLLELHQCETSLVIQVSKDGTSGNICLEDFQALCPIPSIEDAYLVSYSSLGPEHSDFLNALLSVCHPKYISTKLPSDFIEEELGFAGRKAAPAGCCNSLETECWRCQLKDVEGGCQGRLPPPPEPEDWIYGTEWITFGLKW